MKLKGVKIKQIRNQHAIFCFTFNKQTNKQINKQTKIEHEVDFY